MQRFLIAVFSDRDHAEAAVAALQSSGVPAEEISIAAGAHHHPSLIERLGAADTPMVTGSNLRGQEESGPLEAALKAGARLGGVAGLLAGIPLMIATGGGAAVLVAGAIATAIGGGVTGAAAGGLAGALAGMGIPDPQARAAQERVHGGALIVSLRADERHLDGIETLFQAHGVEEILISGVGGAVA